MEYSKLTVDQMFDKLVKDDVDYLQELFTTNNINEVFNYLASNHICYCYLHDDEIEDRYYQSQHWEKELKELSRVGDPHVRVQP